MDDIIKQLLEVLMKIEAMDDPTGPEKDREITDNAHYYLEECIEKIREI